MSKIELPALLNIPEKLIPLITRFNEFQYFLIEGGRGGAKSQSIARFMLYLGEIIKGLRIVFGREIQNTIEESVYTLLKDIINENHLAYNIGATKIDHGTNGTSLRFKGFREQGRLNIKGLEGVDILVIDEAQQLKKETVDVTLPTIRKANSKVFFIMNRMLKDDAVWVAMQGRKDCLHIHIDYFENKHCPAKLINEAEECKKRNTDDYNHIWLGEPLAQANNAVFRNIDAIAREYGNPIPEGIGIQIDPEVGIEYIMGVDLAKSVDHTVFIVINTRLKRVDYAEKMESNNKNSWNYQKEKIKAISKLYNNAQVVIDSTGVGDPIVEDLQRAGVNIWYDQKESGKEVSGMKFTNISKENIIERLKVAIELRMIIIPNIKDFIKELKDFESTILPSGRTRYAAPEGSDEFGHRKYHDDWVFALALALWGIRAELYEIWKSIKEPSRDEKFWNRVNQDMKRNLEENSLQGEGAGRNIGDEDMASVFEDD